ncbi:hypothetical protein ACWCYZ_33970, partial [Streptomyces virginiae]
GSGTRPTNASGHAASPPAEPADTSAPLNYEYPPSFFVELLLEWGADAAHGSVFPAVPFTRPVEESGILTPEGKVMVADRLCAQFGVSRDDCVAYGDSVTDALLFDVVPVSVAVNARPFLAERATHVYEGRDLREAYQLVGLTRPGVDAS